MDILRLILSICATLTSIAQKSFEAHQSAAMVHAAMEGLHQDLKDTEAKIDEAAKKPDMTPEEHQKILDEMRRRAS